MCVRLGETLAVIEDEFELFRRLNEDLIDNAKKVLAQAEPLGPQASKQVWP